MNNSIKFTKISLTLRKEELGKHYIILLATMKFATEIGSLHLITTTGTGVSVIK